MKYFSIFFLIISGFISQCTAQSLSQKMSATAMDIWKDSMVVSPGKPVKWAYDQGVVLEGIANVWKATGDPKYFEYIQKSMDFFVGNDGSIRTYKQSDYNIDNVKNGRSLLLLYNTTGKEKYLKAAMLLREQLKTQPRNSVGGFWHKKVYPNQMWLDGLYMGEPFYTEFAAMARNNSAFDDIANQFILMEKSARDVKTGLLYHGWDESKKEAWANKNTGTSPNFWGRAMGWYAMALVDVLDNFPQDHPERNELLAILNRTAIAIQKYQDDVGLWYDVLDKPTEKGNYHESSAASMFVYAIAKAVRKGYLAPSFMVVADKGYKGIVKEFIEPAGEGKVNLKGTVSVSGLGGKPYRDGSIAYYLKEEVVTNDPKGVGAFILAANEMELAAQKKIVTGKTVLLDSYFNNEFKKDAFGNNVSWHYKWDELGNGGFSLLGEIFRNMGAVTATLQAAPTSENLENASAYIIVDPDTTSENPDAKYVDQNHIQAISDWVKNGGVLVMLSNDSINAEFTHFNKLAEKFGFAFKYNSLNKVTGSNFEMGAVAVKPGNPVFKTAKKVYIKEISSIKINNKDVNPVLMVGNEAAAVTVKYGKGMVLAIGDPWFYNEYTDGRKLPADMENFKAANDFAKWILQQIPGK